MFYIPPFLRWSWYFVVPKWKILVAEVAWVESIRQVWPLDSAITFIASTPKPVGHRAFRGTRMDLSGVGFAKS